MNADEIYKKYIAPPAVVEPEPLPDPTSWWPDTCPGGPSTWLGQQITGPDFGSLNIMDPNTGFNSVMRNNSWIRNIPPPFQIKNIDVSIDNSHYAQRIITITAYYSVGDVWSGRVAAVVPHNIPGPIPPDLLDLTAQKLIQEISNEIRNKLITNPLKEQLSAKIEELYKRGL